MGAFLTHLRALFIRALERHIGPRMQKWMLFTLGWLWAQGFLDLVAGETRVSTTRPAPEEVPWREIYQLALQHVPGVTRAELDRALLNGLLAYLADRAELVSEPESLTAPEPVLGRVEVLDRQVGYIRIVQVAAELPAELSRVWQAVTATNAVAGWVLDLREAGGRNYAAAQATAALFLDRPKALLDWGEGIATVPPAQPPCPGFLVVLINEQTRGAAEALAAALRLGRGAVLVGARTAGSAAQTRLFPLAHGHQLRLAVAPVRLADGTPLSPGGVVPDVKVSVSREAELAWLENPYHPGGPAPEAGLPSTRAPRRPRMDEAALVRTLRRGSEPGSDPAEEPIAPEPAVLRDPALARAVDLIKAVSILQTSGLKQPTTR